MSAEPIKSQTDIEKEAQGKLIGFLQTYKKSFEAVLPKQLTSQRWMWLVVNSIRKTPALAGTTPVSFINSVLLASNLGIEIRDRSSYLIPFGQECQLLIDYRAKIDLAARVGVMLHPELVYEADEFEYGYGGGGLVFDHTPKIVNRENGRLSTVEDRGEVVAGYALIEHRGNRQVIVMTLAEIERIRKRSKKGCGFLSLAELRAVDVDKLSFRDPKRTPWVTDWERMATKTIVHRAFNYCPQSEALALSQEIDAANDTGKMPVAPQLQDAIIFEIDPAHNAPMVEGSFTDADEAREKQQGVAQKRIRQLKGESEPTRTVADWSELPDQIAPELGLCIEVAGKVYTRTDTAQTWAQRK